MFLRRNEASQTFTLPGSLRLIADGSAVTSGTITIQKDGTNAAGGGTLTHLSAGCFKYTPTAGETDCKILGYVLEGTGAVAVCGSIRTTAADPDDATALGLELVDLIYGKTAQLDYDVAGHVKSSVESMGPDTITASALAASAAAEVRAEVDAALAAIGLNYLVATAEAGGVVANNSIVAKLAAGGTTAVWSSYANTQSSLSTIGPAVTSLSGRLTTARCAYLDNLSAGPVATAAGLTGGTVILAAAGLNLISAAEPTGRPTTFPGWVMWLVQRFRRADKSPTAIVVKTEAGSVVTTQAITDDLGGTETLGVPA